MHMYWDPIYIYIYIYTDKTSLKADREDWGEGGGGPSLHRSLQRFWHFNFHLNLRPVCNAICILNGIPTFSSTCTPTCTATRISICT